MTPREAPSARSVGGCRPDAALGQSDGRLYHPRFFMLIRTESDTQGARLAARQVVEIHQDLVDFLRPGLTLAAIDCFIAEALRSRGSRSAFLRYQASGLPPFPSHSCLSVNACIVHGTHTMTEQALEPGDLLSVDIGVVHRGWIGDAAWTYAIAHADPTARRLMQCGREALRRGVAAMQPGRPLVDWARAVQAHAEAECGFHLVRNLGGHGYGRTLHDSPFISNVVPRNRAEWPDAWTTFKPGMLLAVEPMIAVGTPETFSEPRGWPIFTGDRSLSVHYEADVLITEEGPCDLTEGLADLPEIVGD